MLYYRVNLVKPLLTWHVSHCVMISCSVALLNLTLVITWFYLKLDIQYSISCFSSFDISRLPICLLTLNVSLFMKSFQPLYQVDKWKDRPPFETRYIHVFNNLITLKLWRPSQVTYTWRMLSIDEYANFTCVSRSPVFTRLFTVISCKDGKPSN